MLALPATALVARVHDAEAAVAKRTEKLSALTRALYDAHVSQDLLQRQLDMVLKRHKQEKQSWLAALNASESASQAPGRDFMFARDDSTIGDGGGGAFR